MNGYCLHCDGKLTGDEFEYHPQCHPDRPKGNRMIRTAQQWLTCPEFETLSRGNSLAAFATYIEAVQADALEAAAHTADNYPVPPWNGLLTGTPIGDAIRALIPPKPKETP